MSNTRTITVRISNEELAKYMAALNNVEYAPRSVGDIMKAMCRMWMNENAPIGLKVEPRHMNFVLKTDVTLCGITYNKE